MMHTPIGFCLFLGAALSWVGLLMLFGLRHRARLRTAAERDLSHLAAVEAFLAQLLAQAGELGLPSEIERDAREFQSLVADVLHGGAPFTVEEMQDLSDFLHDLTLALPYLPEDGPRLDRAQEDAAEPSTGSHDASRFAQYVGLTMLASALAADMDEGLHDGRYALALASHDPSFSPGAPVSPFDAGGPALIGL
jgi:hypothetical protein